MALLTDGAAARVLFASPVSAAWKALSPIPGFNTGSALADAVSNGTALVIYVINAASGTFAFDGGQAFGYDDTIITVSGSLTPLVTTGDDGTVITYVKDGTDIWTYTATQVLEAQDAGDMTALKAYLP